MTANSRRGRASPRWLLRPGSWRRNPAVRLAFRTSTPRGAPKGEAALAGAGARAAVTFSCTGSVLRGTPGSRPPARWRLPLAPAGLGPGHYHPGASNLALPGNAGGSATSREATAGGEGDWRRTTGRTCLRPRPSDPAAPYVSSLLGSLD